MKSPSSYRRNERRAERFAESKLFGLWSPRAAAAVLAAGLAVVYAGADPPDGPFPPEDDPSHFTGPLIEDLPEGLPEANEGSFEGGETGTSEDAGTNNVLPEAEQREDGEYNVPTNGPPSPLFGAAEFSQQMLRFEEFGTRPYLQRWPLHATAWRPRRPTAGCRCWLPGAG